MITNMNFVKAIFVKFCQRMETPLVIDAIVVNMYLEFVKVNHTNITNPNNVQTSDA